MSEIVLTALIFTPTLGAIFLGFAAERRSAAMQRAALVFSLVPLLLSLGVLAAFDPARGDFQIVERMPGCPTSGFSTCSASTASASSSCC